MAKIRPHLFIGARYAFDFYYNREIEEGGLLDVNRPTGVFAGVNNGLGPALLYDTRSGVFYPRSG
ncbi:MAG: hypothetical protein P8M61_04875 [Crocinitomicaceae bacterium]|nr:hypothetical protein [Crocinitomicaceae bacterium]MDG2464402.1 hypothetical protein [Crocinitomicaceae bacterium]